MKAKLLFIYILVALCYLLTECNKVTHVEEFSDPKLFKQLLRVRNNVMVLFTESKDAASSIFKAYREAASEVRGIGTMVFIDCGGQGQKLCRQLKASPSPYLLHHYKDGKFHKVYDRSETTKSLVRFMNDPSGDVPWEEEEGGKNVVHLDSPKALGKLLKKHKKVLVMFYAPWCVYCKQMKPEFAAAAAKVRANGLGILAAMDVVRPENSGMRTKFNITGFPTVHYFKNGEVIATYEGENKQDKIVDFMKDPKALPVKEKETPWSEEESYVHHLTDNNFDQFIKSNPSTLVMFYAPWCGHCKRLKPEWTQAAEAAHKLIPNARLAAVDSTKESLLGERFKVKGYPTLKYFKDGEFAFDTPTLRSKDKILAFLKDPTEPPPPPPPEPNWADVPSEVLHLTEDSFRSQLKAKRHALVMFYAPWCGHCKAAKPEFEAAAEELKDEPRLVLAAVNCVEFPALCKIYEVKGYPTIKYFNYLKKERDYEGGRKAADFVSYLRSFEPETLVKSQSVEITTDQTITETQPSALTDTEKRALDKMKKDQEEEQNANYPGWDKLLHLTDDNYKILLLEHKHLFIMFHAKWCRYCKDLKPAFAEIAQTHDPELGTLAACDADKAPNMVDDLQILSLPTFKYIRDGKPMMDFKGERTPQALKEFIRTMKTVKDEL